MSLYEDCIKEGLVMDHHESDLYLRDTAHARHIIARHGLTGEPFRCNISGEMWLDVKFAYAPHWPDYRPEECDESEASDV